MSGRIHPDPEPPREEQEQLREMSRPPSAGPPAAPAGDPPAPAANGNHSGSRPVTPKVEGQSSDDGSAFMANKADIKVGGGAIFYIMALPGAMVARMAWKQ